MADETFKPFDDAKPEILDKLQAGFTLDDEKLGDLKQAYEDVKGDISKLDLTLYSKAPTDTPAPEQGQAPSVVNDDATPAPTPEDPKWKDGVLKEWQQWANDNNKLLSPYQDSDNQDNLSFKLYADENAKNSDNFEADFSYASPKNVTLKGKDGQVPDEKYFDKLVTQLKAANGPEIEFGNIKSDEFKAKLLAACLKDPEIIITNAPSEQDIASWDKSLQDMIKVKPQEKEEKNEDNKTLEAMKRVAKKRLELRERKKDNDGKNLPDQDLQSWKDIDTNKEGLTEDQLKLRDLRNGVRKGDAKAIEEMDKRRETTMTDDFKYEREVEMEADGKTPKNDAKGKPIYKQVTEMEADGKTPKKDKDGNPVYKKDEKGNPVYVHKTDDKGNKIESPAYQSFKKRLDGYNKGK